MNDESSIKNSSAVAGRSPRPILVFLAITLTVLASDLTLKWWSFKNIEDHESVQLVRHVLDLKLTRNHGAVFGMGQGGRTVFVLITLVAIAVIGVIFWRSRSNQRMLHIALALILAGAIGNLFDRIAYGAVRDMLYLLPGTDLPFGWHWPGGSRELYPWIFNIADVALCLGVALIMLTMARNKPATHSQQP